MHQGPEKTGHVNPPFVFFAFNDSAPHSRITLHQIRRPSHCRMLSYRAVASKAPTNGSRSGHTPGQGLSPTRYTASTFMYGPSAAHPYTGETLLTACTH